MYLYIIWLDDIVYYDVETLSCYTWGQSIRRVLSNERGKTIISSKTG